MHKIKSKADGEGSNKLPTLTFRGEARWVAVNQRSAIFMLMRTGGGLNSHILPPRPAQTLSAVNSAVLCYFSWSH